MTVHLSPPDPPQPDALFDLSDIPVLVGAPAGSIEDRFLHFHEANPWVYQRLRILALDLVRAGRRRIGVGMLWEVLRWQYARATKSDDGLKLNNDYRSRYARLLAKSEPELVDAFETRRLRSA
jgi:hypothetical protein